MDEFEKELKSGFLEEASQLLSDVEQSYLQLESDPSNSTIIDQIFRVAHNLKGSSKAVGFNEMGAFAHEFENLLLKIKNGEISPNTEIVNVLLKCNDHITMMVNTLRDDMSASFESSHLITLLQSAVNGELGLSSIGQNQGDEQVPSADAFSEEDDSTLDNSELAGLSQAQSNEPALSFDDELQRLIDQNFIEQKEATVNSAPPAVKNESKPADSASVPPTSQVAKSEKANSPHGASASTAEESIRVSISRLEKLLNYVGEMVILQTVLKEQSLGANQLLRKTVDQLGKVSKEVQDISMSLRMVPLKQTFQKMQRIVRDTSNSLGKKVNLVIQGDETEVDKTVLEHLSDPLVHLVRNACDHGIESPERRTAAGKSETGTLTLTAYHKSGKLVIDVIDDGAGINPEVLIRKATEKGILKAGQKISDAEAIRLIFHPGFSTKAQVTDVSGRGVGMDVVKTNIESLQGEVLIETEVGKGSTFKVVLPLTLAIIDGMVISLNSSRYVVPLSHVHESVRLNPDDIKITSGLGEVLLLRGENLPLFRLRDLVSGKAPKTATSDSIALIFRIGKDPFALAVDDIIGQFQVVIKKLGLELENVKGFSGSAILGDGKPALILEMSELIQKSNKTGFKSLNKGVSI